MGGCLKVATHSLIATLDDLTRVPGSRTGTLSVLSDYWALTKPEINFLIAVTTAAGFWMGTAEGLTDFPWLAFLQSILGTALVASGASTLNQLIELPYDARMRRTARRPLPSGRMASSHALWFGVALSVLGVAWLAVSANAVAASLAALTLVGYLFVYTPLKRITPLCILVGAIPGAAPPLIGWAAARGHLDPGAWELFAIVFLWQFPHFMPIAWMYRHDYAHAGYLVLPSVENGDRFVIWQTVAAGAALFVVGLLPTIGRLSGFAYFAGALTLGGILLLYSARFAIHRTTVAARQLLLVSILYLPAIFALLVLDKK
jgi:protoheme IX farnesyltransferase